MMKHLNSENMKKNILILIVIFLTLHKSVVAQEDSKSNMDVYIHVGYNLGGLAPVSFPNTIREIKSYSPGFSPVIGLESSYKLKGGWGIGSGIGLDWKGMKVTDRVQYFHTIITMDGSSLEGDFTGTNTTNVKNMYLSIPLYASYTTENRWRFKGGMYFAWLLDGSFTGSVSDGYLRKGNSLGEKVEVDYAAFDFSDELNNFDLGISVGAEKYLFGNFGVAGNLKWGLIPGFPESFTGIDFNMYNIYLDLGITYKIF
ncbi:hypothetical protein FHS59_003890 [Algoriphagus iocasae]|uniref:Outer membrane protein beta-barrel domain-containing protein n=1 Tax=Algoriphagus iocasae TaxID=1836499 RepID=A0A841MRU5_9BACT|nr:outer membrane beta-barrel protein [Algoriphagus iocasae]MBB6328247.1 hypothetical protein [Algoriphagus iocasae]